VKTFVPGEIARAEDVNGNFSELKGLIDKALNGIQSGMFSTGSYRPGEAYEGTVKFPRAFASVPRVTVAVASQRLRIAVYGISTTGFTYYLWNDTDGQSGGENSAQWIATTL
jgi:hypothetical protein